MLRAERKHGLLLVWLAMFLLLAVPLYGQSILTQAVSGTGFIVSSDGYIITNRHVINGATNISVTIRSKEYEARVVDSLSDNDIALLKVDAHGLPMVMLGDSSNVGIGDTVYAIGCPAGVCGTITQGRVANLGISSKTDEGTTLHNLIMSDLTTTHGSSGGPLLNDRGEVIGITTAGIVVQGETTGFGVSIPINQAIPLLQRAPGFNTSRMGKATTVLTLDGIRRSVGPNTVFVQAEIQRPLADLLPQEALGRTLKKLVINPGPLVRNLPFLPMPGNSGGLSISSALWNYLLQANIQLLSAAEAYKKTIKTNVTEVVSINAFKCSSASEALHALTYVNDPTRWQLHDVRDLTSIYQSSTLLSTSREIHGASVNAVITAKPFPPGSTTQFLLLCMNSSNATFHPELELWGWYMWVLNDILFMECYYNDIKVSSTYPACATLNGVNLGGDSGYKWRQAGTSFIFSHYLDDLLSIDYEPFVNIFNKLTETIFQILAN